MTEQTQKELGKTRRSTPLGTTLRRFAVIPLDQPAKSFLAADLPDRFSGIEVLGLLPRPGTGKLPKA